MGNKDIHPFESKYNLTDKDLGILWLLFIEHGMTKGEAPHRTKGNHYFLQGICQYYQIEWNSWKSKLSPFIREFIEKIYPQLMVTDKSHERTY